MNGEKHRGKPKNRFTLCCFCLGGSGSDADLSSATYDYSDKCDYVVEKLTIKKVPISMFATEEDLEEMKKNSMNFNEKEFSDLDKIGNVENDKSDKKDEEILLKPILKQNEMAKVDVHQVVLEEPNRFNLTPELQETLKVLGTKRPPENCQDIKQRMGVKVVQNLTRSISPNVKHVTIIENDENFLQTIKDTQESNVSKNVSTTTTTSFQSNSTVQHFFLRQSDISSQFHHQKEIIDDKLKQHKISPPIIVDEHGIIIEKEDVDVRLTSNELEAMMRMKMMKTDENEKNITNNQSQKVERNDQYTSVNNDTKLRMNERKEPVGVYNVNPRWKIIIKEHQGKDVSGSKSSVSSKSLTATSGSDDEDGSDEEESDDDEDDDDDDDDVEDEEISQT
ncbi:transcription initiation factor TFIID subunit 11-like isoform X2 [Onthophagus taurus]|uniref:transcription initiation factor TFIID subunit 11-like isoform X2 n=1 Tax=Onthophagus taurus TaxID=166361 RepID=UPI0039BE6A8E